MYIYIQLLILELERKELIGPYAVLKFQSREGRKRKSIKKNGDNKTNTQML